jgi:hypothetical protein
MKSTANKGVAMTAKTFRNNVERILRQAHPDASVAITWNFARKVSWFDGSEGYSGTLIAAAPGYRQRLMVASYSHGEYAVR